MGWKASASSPPSTAVLIRLPMFMNTLRVGLARLVITAMVPDRSTTNSRLVSPGGTARAMGAVKISAPKALTAV